MVTRVPSPVFRRALPGLTGWPVWAWVSRAPISSPSGRVWGAVRQPRRARRASACHPPNPLARLSGSPASTSARDRPAPRVMILLSSPAASQSVSSSASSITTTPGAVSEVIAAVSSSSLRSGPVNEPAMPGRDASDRSGEGRGVTRMTWAPPARKERVIDASTVERPERAGPATINAGMPSDRSGPSAVGSSPPAPASPHSGRGAAARRGAPPCRPGGPGGNPPQGGGLGLSRRVGGQERDLGLGAGPGLVRPARGNVVGQGTWPQSDQRVVVLLGQLERQLVFAHGRDPPGQQRPVSGHDQVNPGAGALGEDLGDRVGQGTAAGLSERGRETFPPVQRD